MIVYILLATNKISTQVYVPFVTFSKEKAIARKKEMLELNPMWKSVAIKEREVKE